MNKVILEGKTESLLMNFVFGSNFEWFNSMVLNIWLFFKWWDLLFSKKEESLRAFSLSFREGRLLVRRSEGLKVIMIEELSKV